MEAANGNTGNANNLGNGDRRDRSASLRRLRLELLVLVGALPLACLVLEALGLWRLTAEWVTLYGILAAAVLTVHGFTLRKDS